MKTSLMAGFFLLLVGVLALTQPSDHPAVVIHNEAITARIYLPDKDHGFYRGTRFDWSGVIYSLKLADHDYYGPWFTKTDPSVHDFIYQGNDIVAGPCSATSGPADEFAELGFESAAPGSTFVKIGVGALRKPDAQPYDNYRLYEIADGGVWHIHKKPNAVEFVQTLTEKSSGYAYVYTKTVELTPDKAQMVMHHSLKNSGKLAIQTNVYNHNFFVLDHKPPSKTVSITLPFAVHSPEPPDPALALIRKNQILYQKELSGRDTVATPIEGFSSQANDNQFRLENTAVGAGMSAATDRPLLKESLWSIRSVVAVEPFVAISIDPGATFDWTTHYNYYTLPAH